ncbi:A/G-specific adenine glycosylase [Christensenella tenuis]|uniref:Adenine DNA glycosylase n=1 Tax=Christensenella tenuis TaxID=2763033 RepID=A0ABR7EHI5_9FIRM|nr:A/G-specific adenine glycosylase [Christensenella tenuis]MBC5649240.1 A/G-specific adenine glycosylase [Christensenella tenuis]
MPQYTEQRDGLPGIPGPLLQWYGKNARILPWRDVPTPYRVWISEIMLQQTRVTAVMPYYERFLHALPNPAALASVPDEELMKLWEGLGYYNRARNLKKAAQIIVNEFGGDLPSSFDALLSLPGIGSYTAGAIASIAFGIPVPAVDGNVLRVISRVCASYDNISDAKVKQRMEQELTGVMPRDCAGDFNQALMELGATVCLPNGGPLCAQCPLAALCKAHLNGLTNAIPVKTAKKKRRIEARTVFVILNKSRVALKKRKDTGLLADLWEFPNTDGALSPAEAENYLRQNGIEPLGLAPLAPAKHIFTHVEWHMTGYLATTARQGGQFTWSTRSGLEKEYALPSAFRVYSKAAMHNLKIPRTDSPGVF